MRPIPTCFLILAYATVLSACAGARIAGKAAPDTVTNAVSSPLYDVNVLRTKIPAVLVNAVDAPYALPDPMTCAEIAALVRPLDEALGPDLDMDISVDDPSLLARGRGEAMNALGDAASSIIPLNGWVRKLSGAETHDRFVHSAIAAGGVRRAYLKGIGQRLSCRPPAAPTAPALRRVTPGVYPNSKNGDVPFQPRYPIR